MNQHVFYVNITYNGYTLSTIDTQTAAEEWLARTMVRLARELRPASLVQLREFACIESGCTTHRT